MLDRYRSLSQREQMLIAVLGALAALLVLIYGIIFPILGFERQSMANFREAARLAALTEGLEAPGVESADDRALRSVVTEAAERQGISYTRISNTPDGRIELDINGTASEDFFAWLANLEAESGIVVTSAFVTPGEAPGTVEARITLGRGQ
ncbi:type II secretion system protein GspM [Parvularcula lutaonensis]|uniref:Type II secretion system protein GspM n=1 Tax=Parvularcula lutaonensis TaxID=491923 RepID=A0ABV7MEH6_9PROT|nr:type II secretion system protein GspM [Parvularcula lutaonensis]GGY52748.1 hypothetical protein GCM10007148_22470 [Parvularcula lutaonensis]